MCIRDRALAVLAVVGPEQGHALLVLAGLGFRQGGAALGQYGPDIRTPGPKPRRLPRDLGKAAAGCLDFQQRRGEGMGPGGPRKSDRQGEETEEEKRDRAVKEQEAMDQKQKKAEEHTQELIFQMKAMNI